MPVTTHILVVYKSQNSELLYRASDGICLGQRKNETVIYGEQPNRRGSHVFLNGEQARAFLRDTVSKRDLKTQQGWFARLKARLWGAQPVAVEQRDAEHLVELAPDSIMLPGEGVYPMQGQGRAN